MALENHSLVSTSRFVGLDYISVTALKSNYTVFEAMLSAIHNLEEVQLEGLKCGELVKWFESNNFLVVRQRCRWFKLQNKQKKI